MTAFYMWRLMNMTFYGKSRVTPEVAAHIHESPASMTVPLTRAGHRQRARRLAGRAQAVDHVRRELPRLRDTGSSRPSPRPRSKRRNEGEHSALHRVDADGPLGGDRDRRHHWWRATSTITSPRSRTRIGEVASRRCTGLLSNKWYVDEIYDFLFVNGLCKGGGLLLAPSTATWWMAASTAPAG